jgi:hypothetical protein
MKIIESKYLGIKWLKNKTIEGGALYEVLKIKTPDSVVVHLHNKEKGRLWSYMDKKDLLELVIKKNYGLYEVISSYPHKVYFDIDCEPKDLEKIKVKSSKELLENIIKILSFHFPNPEFAISGVLTKSKYSYHIAISNYIITSNEERDELKSLVTYFKEDLNYPFDTKVYTQNRNFKCINQSKLDGRIQKIIENNDPKKHLITCYFNEVSNKLPIFDDEDYLNFKVKNNIVTNKTLNLGLLPVLENLEVLPEKFNLSTASPKEILRIIPLNKSDSFDHVYTHRVARYCYHNGLTIEDFLSWYSRKSNSLTNYNKWSNIHWPKLVNFPDSTKQIKSILYKYYPQLINEEAYNLFIDQFKLDISKVEIIDNLSTDLFEIEKKFIIMNIQMGKGKTHVSLEYLKEKNEFLWITPNIALGENTIFRLNEIDVDCDFYIDFKNKKTKKIHESNKLVVCLNSLYKLSRRSKGYKIVIIDEIETLLIKWFNNSTLKENKLECWNQFLRLLRSADKVIFLDAFTTKLTTNFIDNLGYKNDYKIYQMPETDSNRNIRILNKLSNWFSEIVELLKQNKKVFIFYPYKSGQAFRKIPAMEDFKKILEKETLKSGVCYNAESDDITLQELKNINESWKNHNFVITNTKITVGVNYELNDFDSVFLSIAEFNLPRDIVQVSYRCRNIQSSNINVCFINKKNNNKCFEHDNEITKCNIYSQLVNDILIERFSPLEETFYYFCKKANYKLHVSNDKLNKEISAYFINLYKTNNSAYTFNTILDISGDDLFVIRDRINICESTLDDKIRLLKYYYVKMFNPTDDKTLLAQGFDDKFIYFFEVLKDLKTDENNILKKIKDYNNWEYIIPHDNELSNVKLSDELVNEIFDKFHFKNLTKKSSKKEIIKNIFNTYFNKKIILSRKIDTNHYESYIDENVRLLFHYGMKNLKSNTEKKTEVNYKLELLDFDDSDSEKKNNLEEDNDIEMNLENKILSNVKSNLEEWYKIDHNKSKKYKTKNNSV